MQYWCYWWGRHLDHLRGWPGWLHRHMGRTRTRLPWASSRIGDQTGCWERQEDRRAERAHQHRLRSRALRRPERLRPPRLFQSVQRPQRFSQLHSPVPKPSTTSSRPSLPTPMSHSDVRCYRRITRDSRILAFGTGGNGHRSVVCRHSSGIRVRMANRYEIMWPNSVLEQRQQRPKRTYGKLCREGSPRLAEAV